MGLSSEGGPEPAVSVAAVLNKNWWTESGGEDTLHNRAGGRPKVKS